MNKSTIAHQTKTASFLPPAQGNLQRKCACGNHTVAGGECVECAKNKSGLQRKLTIGASNDPLEREADRVAEQVMAASTHSVAKSAPPFIRRSAGQANQGTDIAPDSVEQVLASPGKPLDPPLQQDMERRFGHDFSQVRVHLGGAAEQSAHAVNADAYATGHNIVFGSGQFMPRTQKGRRLLAHELTHVIQQSSGARSALQREFNSGPPGAPPRPVDKAPTGQPANEPELAKLKPYWDKDKKQWTYADAQYKEVKGTAVVRGVSPSDVHQGMVGDCYLMAALASLAVTSPATIESAITADGPGKWKVRLYAKQTDNSFKAMTYPVDNMFPSNSAGGMIYGHSNQLGTKRKSMGRTYVDNKYNDPLIYPGDIPADAEQQENFAEILDEDNRELWPAIIEKAYAMHALALGKKQQGERAGGYDDIDQGDASSVAFEALTGKPASEIALSELGGDKLFSKIDAALRAGAPVAAGTPGDEKKRNEKLMAGSNIYGHHAYSVMTLRGKEIELRNPWGNTYKSTDVEEHPELKGKDDSGTIKLSLEEFRSQFDSVYIGTATVPVKSP